MKHQFDIRFICPVGVKPGDICGALERILESWKFRANGDCLIKLEMHHVIESEPMTVVLNEQNEGESNGSN
jgi:hypothetical protein